MVSSGLMHGHHRAELVTVIGQVPRPPPGRSSWPLTLLGLILFGAAFAAQIRFERAHKDPTIEAPLTEAVTPSSADGD